MAEETTTTQRPARVYRYGLLNPTLNRDLVIEQLYRANRYYNRLIEITREASLALTQLQEADPLLVAAKKQFEIDKDKLVYRGLVKARKTDADYMAKMNVIYEAKKQKINAARAESQVFWGTYLITERAAEAAGKVKEPRFRRWTGEGAVAVQCQGGLNVPDLLACEDTRVQISPIAEPVPGRGGRPLRRVRLRVGSTPDRSPVWAEWPIIYHRPLPESGAIKWVSVQREVVASKEQWYVCFTVEQDPVPTENPPTPKVVALDLGWRQEEATLRAGGYTDGLTGQDILLDPSVLSSFDKVNDLRSIRDKNRDVLHSYMLDWRKQASLPDEHKEQVYSMGLWKSSSRFAKLAIWWRTNRLPDDEEMFERLEAWRKQDKHLWLWEANLRRKAIARRRDQYRVVASKLVKAYDTLVVEKLTLDKLALVPEDPKDSHPKSRSQRFATAPSELRHAVVQAFKAQNKRIAVVSAGPLSSVWQRWCEGLGVPLVYGASRSKRFSRLRKKAAPETAQPAA